MTIIPLSIVAKNRLKASMNKVTMINANDGDSKHNQIMVVIIRPLIIIQRADTVMVLIFAFIFFLFKTFKRAFTMFLPIHICNFIARFSFFTLEGISHQSVYKIISVKFV